ncbi:MAG: alkaline phosphatase [Asgard group archaeon]|nr:alkaline phosphatase [Asgard group archaeon]
MQKNHLRTKILFFQVISLLFIGLTLNLVNSELNFKEETNYSIILMIGDGMGFEHVKLARYVELGKNQNLSMESLDLNISVMTHNAFFETTDSAAAATAIATGVKTFNRRIAIGPDGSILETILEIAQELNKSTGLVTTTSIQHATPASFMTHVLSRSNYDEITRQIVEANVDILFGGGLEDFSTPQLEEMKNNGYSFVENKTALEAISGGKILGLFADGHLGYEQDRNFSLIPSLADMTCKAIEILNQDTDGFFLMVEGGRIDHGSHDNNKVNAIHETIAFDLAVKEALNYVKNHSNTILIVTADHETGGLAYINDNFDTTLPSAINTEDENRTIRITRINQLDVSWSSGGHTKRHVPFFAYGEAYENISDVSLIDNTEIFDVMNNYFLDEEISLFNRQPVDKISLRMVIILVVFSHTSILIVVVSIRKKSKFRT